MCAAKVAGFDVAAFLANAGVGRKLMEVKPKQPLFVQGEPGTAIYYIKGQSQVVSYF